MPRFVRCDKWQAKTQKVRNEKHERKRRKVREKEKTQPEKRKDSELTAEQEKQLLQIANDTFEPCTRLARQKISNKSLAPYLLYVLIPHSFIKRRSKRYRPLSALSINKARWGRQDQQKSAPSRSHRYWGVLVSGYTALCSHQSPATPISFWLCFLPFPPTHSFPQAMSFPCLWWRAARLYPITLGPDRSKTEYVIPGWFRWYRYRYPISISSLSLYQQSD